MVVTKRGLAVVVLAVLLPLLFLLFLLPQSQAQTAGCYVYSQASEDLYCIPGVSNSQAQEDCNSHRECSLSQYFLPGSDCSSLPQCEEVTCSVDCQQHALGFCQRQNGVAVPSNQYDHYCAPGCCKLGTQFCQFGLNRYQCVDTAARYALPAPPSPPNSLFVNPPGMTLAVCNQQYCQVQITAGRMSGFVLDREAHPIIGAELVLEGTTQPSISSLADGSYNFPGLSPSTYLVTVRKNGYLPLSRSVSVTSGQALEQNFTLVATAGLADISGIITQQQTGDPLSGATISWRGLTTGQVFSDATGHYEIPDLSSGEYTLAVSKIGYALQEQTLMVANQNLLKDFSLSPAAQQSVTGTTWVDAVISNGLADPTEKQYGVKIYIDGQFRGYSQYPDGRFDISLPAGEHRFSASYLQYQLAERTFTISAGQPTSLGDLLLTTYVGECSEGQPGQTKNVQQFSLQHLPGEKVVRLDWVKPCPEVIGYHLTKNGELWKPFSPADNSFTDLDVEWGATYTYGIKAVYGGGQTRYSETENLQTITLGNAACEGRHHSHTGWENFCQIGALGIRKTVYTCNNQNQLVSSFNCAERDGSGESFFCAQTSETTAECQNAGTCNLYADPFGLYYTRNLCYGTAQAEEAENFCYFDSTHSIVNQCHSCADINSCFEYRSKDACTVNNCLGTPCQWIDAAANSEPLIDYHQLLPGLVSSETGQGYCVQQTYENDDKCSLCSRNANLFENYYCTADVCSGLGRCFADSQLSACDACGDTPSRDSNCYSYNTEQECAGASSVWKNAFGEIVKSDDRCSWDRCAWRGIANGFGSGSCVKDGDADSEDDCASFSTGTERFNCKLDVSPPKTSIVPSGIQVVSLVHPNITFIGDDSFHSSPAQNNVLGTLSYCVLSANLNAPAFCRSADFVNSEVSYPGRTKQELVTVNLLSSFQLQQQINGETYRLKYYSKDKYHNQEEIKESFVFIDNVAPQFDINQHTATLGDQTDLTVYLEGLNEPMGCTFALAGVLPRSAIQAQTLDRQQQQKEVTFSGLPGVIYDVNVTCIDNQGNINSKGKRLVFDQEQRIVIVHPEFAGTIAAREISFRATTVTGSQCELYHHDEKVADFLTDENGKVHETAAIPGFTEGRYAGEYQIICKELLTDKSYTDYFDFTVDFTGPSTQIILREGPTRTIRPTGFGWEEFFVSAAQVDFECHADGFSCDTTHYCLGEDCDFIASPDYRDYSGTITVTNSTQICYYSVDVGDTPVYSPLCGQVNIVGYGIQLELPPLHYYQNEQWGISNHPTFDWRFLTKVPTKECRFDFIPGFSYDSAPPFKILHAADEHHYSVTGFPSGTGASPYPDAGGVKTLYVKCRNLNGDISPEQKMNVEYDPTAPNIIEAKAVPPLLLEGIKVDLAVLTDDKTLCKYSDSGQQDYLTMNHAFPGAEAEVTGADPASIKVLQERHLTDYFVNSFIGLTKEFRLLTICRNGAGDLSQPKQINFTVDYTQLGGITSVWPHGEIFDFANILLTLHTSKSAACQYAENGQFLPLNQTGGITHTQHLTNTTEGFHQVPVRCTMGDHLATSEATFTLDLTPPSINSIDDGNVTCGQNISLYVYTNEQNISAYHYEVYDQGVDPSILPSTNFSSNRASLVPFRSSSMSTSSMSTSNTSNLTAVPSRSNVPAVGTLIFRASAGPQQPLQISTSVLNDSHRYITRVRATDVVNHNSTFVNSDGVVVVNATHPRCRDATPPLITVTSNSSCTTILVELHGEDALGLHKIGYGSNPTAASCNSTQNYIGQKIPFSQSSYLCFYAENNAKKNVSGGQLISFVDADGDGVRDADSCDLCPQSPSGKIVDLHGCADNQAPPGQSSLDQDNDQLPDYWEQLYNKDGCPLLFTAADSDHDGLSDAQEDYDDDGYTNFAEYTHNQNPCSKDAPLPGLLEKLGEGKNITLPSVPQPVAGKKETDYLPWILLILGLLLVAGGTGYLIYYYKYGEIKKSGRPFPSISAGKVAAEPVSSWRKPLPFFKRQSAEKSKLRVRENVFGEFHHRSEIIPHLDSLLQKKTAATVPEIKELAQKYVEHKEEIKPGLRSEEKSIFSRLEKIAAPGKEKSSSKTASKTISKDQAQDLFAKLKELAKKRKEQ